MVDTINKEGSHQLFLHFSTQAKPQEIYSNWKQMTTHKMFLTLYFHPSYKTFMRLPGEPSEQQPLSGSLPDDPWTPVDERNDSEQETYKTL